QVAAGLGRTMALHAVSGKYGPHFGLEDVFRVVGRVLAPGAPAGNKNNRDDEEYREACLHCICHPTAAKRLGAVVTILLSGYHSPHCRSILCVAQLQLVWITSKVRFGQIDRVATPASNHVRSGG